MSDTRPSPDEQPRDTPLHRRPAALVLVFAGGAVGTGTRAVLTALSGSLPVGTMGINIVGAFLLGLLASVVRRRGPRTARTLTLLLGTGFLGGFTTYSALSLESVDLLSSSGAGPAALYGLGSVVLGLLAAGAGLACGVRMRGPRPMGRRHP